MNRPSRRHAMIPRVFAASLAIVTLAVPLARPEREAVAAETFTARGIVKSFGPDRKYVNIAHDKIPGYMEAMTMSFEARAPAQLDSIAVGDHVTFRFTEVEGGHRLLETIKKE